MFRYAIQYIIINKERDIMKSIPTSMPPVRTAGELSFRGQKTEGKSVISGQWSVAPMIIPATTDY